MLLRDYFNPSNFYKKANYPGTKSAGATFELRKRMKNSSSIAHVLHKTLNLVITCCCFAEDGKEMYQNLKRTCRAIVFPHYTYCFEALSLRYRRRRGCLSSLLSPDVFRREQQRKKATFRSWLLKSSHSLIKTSKVVSLHLPVWLQSRRGRHWLFCLLQSKAHAFQKLIGQL